MITAGFLALYSVVIMAAGPPLLRRTARGGYTPRFAILIWMTAIFSVLLCWPTAAILIAIELGEHTTRPDGVVATCLQAARAIMTGEAGAVAQGVAWLLLGLGAAAPVIVAVRVALLVRRMRLRAREHASAVRIVGHSAGDDIVVMPSTEPVAYCVAGRRPAIILTTATLSMLSTEQLDAIVAHERAHLAGRHAAVVELMRGLATALPRLRLFKDGAAQVSTLLEMRADDVAARRHGRPALLAGLIALSGAATPDAGLAAAREDVVERARRLAGAGVLSRSRACGQTLLGAAAMMTAAAGPVSIAALVVTGTLLCTS